MSSLGRRYLEHKVDIALDCTSNPHGGYLLAVIVDALTKHQAESKPHHPDPAHLMTQFLQGTKPGKAEIHVKVRRCLSVNPIGAADAVDSPLAGSPNGQILDESYC